MRRERPERANGSSIPTSEEIVEIARTLALHSGGPVPLDLAIDLVLHDILEHVREVTRATGAAIALDRNGEVVCRATTGENAPDLGVRVETTSGLVGACLETGKIQYCQDAESDSQVSREACRRLGVRSMLVMPLSEADGTLGLLEVFSPAPNAFGDKEIVFLQSLARQVARSIAEVRQFTKPDPSRNDLVRPPHTHEFVEQGPDGNGLLEEPYSPQNASTGNARELWTAVLFLLVIASAVALGIVVGWTGGIKGRTGKILAKPASADLVSTEAHQSSSTPMNAASTHKSVIPQSSKDVKSPTIPEGGLLVTQNGKVIYSSADPTNKGQARPRSGEPERRLIHRVEPDYPKEARAQHVEGTVLLDAEVEPSGEIGKVAVVSGDPLLSDAAVRAVKQWRYQGMPNASQARISLNFVLPAR